jgi:perosamine synthetase
MVCTNDKVIADYIRAARNQGRLPGDTWLVSSIMGYNFRMTDIQAVIGIEQLKRIDGIMGKRHNVYLRYVHNLILDSRIRLQQFSDKWDQLSHFVFTVEVLDRPRVMQYLAEHGIETRAYFPCVTDMPHIKALGYRTDDYPVAKEVSERTLALPFYTDMTEEEVNYVCEKLKEALKA